MGGLDAYTIYKFAVYAKNSLGSSVKSAVVTATTRETSKFAILYKNSNAKSPDSAYFWVSEWQELFAYFCLDYVFVMICKLVI